MSFLVLILLFLSTFHAHQARPISFHGETYALSKASHLDIEKKAKLLDSNSRVEPFLISVGFLGVRTDRYIDKNNSEKTSFRETVLWEEIKIKEKKRQLRKMMKHAANNTEKEVVDSEETEVGEDMVVMDYAQPHRKPPIHNEKP